MAGSEGKTNGRRSPPEQSPIPTAPDAGRPPFLFIDIEASSLAEDSVPIEVAWVDEDGEGRSHLVRPQPNWLDWSEEAEAIHQISRQHLIEAGEPAPAVARALHEACRGHIVVSDAPAYDAAWLRTLLGAAGLKAPAVRPVQLAYAQALAPFLRDHSGTPADLDREGREQQARLAQSIIAECEEVQEASHGRAHRALPDALALWRVWRSVTKRTCLVSTRRETPGPDLLSALRW